MYSRSRAVGPVPRTLSSTDPHNTIPIPMPTPERDQMDPEVRAQVQSNIHVIYEPAVASHVHIATCRGTDATFMAFLVMHGNLLKTVWNPNLLAGDARPTRAAAMLSLLEATEDRIRDMLLKSNNTTTKNSNSKTSRPRTSGKDSNSNIQRL